MSIYGQIGYTRRDKTPAHWRDDYHLKPTAKKMIAELRAEREQLFEAFEALPNDISDEEYNQRQHELRVKLNLLIDREDQVRQQNKR